VLKSDEFQRWIEASHAMFEIFEGRYDVYPLAVRWAKEWLNLKKFNVSKEDTEIVNHLIDSFNYDAYRNYKDKIEKNGNKWANIVKRADQQFKTLKNLKSGNWGNIGFGVAPFLFSWNFQRFKEYVKKKRNFDLQNYAEKLGKILEYRIKLLKEFSHKRLTHEEVAEEKVKKIFDDINSELRKIGIGNNEPVGTIKLLHVFSPYYFPLIDNKIASVIGLSSLTSDSYVEWMKVVRRWLQRYYDLNENLEQKFHFSILKLMDQGLYIMSSVKLRARVENLGLKVN